MTFTWSVQGSGRSFERVIGVEIRDWLNPLWVIHTLVVHGIAPMHCPKQEINGFTPFICQKSGSKSRFRRRVQVHSLRWWETVVMARRRLGDVLGQGKLRHDARAPCADIEGTETQGALATIVAKCLRDRPGRCTRRASGIIHRSLGSPICYRISALRKETALCWR